MSYPQPNADQYAINGYQYFRLNTLLSSPGDIYESPQSGLAFALGPESDISRVNIAYFDDQVPTFMQQTVIGPSRSYVGRVDARNEVSYQPSARPGRVMFWSEDLYNPAFRPPGFDALIDQINFVTPRLDVLQYFSSPPAILPTRVDRTYNLRDVITGVIETADNYIMIPYWGRKYGMVEVTNKGTDPWSFGISGVNFSMSNTSGYHQIVPLLADAPIVVDATSKTIVTPADGMFDMLMLRFHRIGPALSPVTGPVRIHVSDSQH